jgi:hypothetical protein
MALKKNYKPDKQFGLVDVDDASALLGKSKSWLYKSTSLCIIPHFKIGNKLLFKIDELLKFVEANRTEILR